MKRHSCVFMPGMLFVLMLCLGMTALATCPCGVDHDLTQGNWDALTASGGVLESGNYYLEEDIQLETDLTIASGATVHLCLNDCVLQGTGTQSVITVETWADADQDGLLDTPGGVLYLYDKETDLTKRYGAWEDGVYDIDSVRAVGDTSLWGGVITGGIGSVRIQSDGAVVSFGGGINVRTGAVAHVFGGTIAGNSAQTGGGIMVSGHLTMDGGTIVDNYAQFGGGINNSGLLVKTAGVIEGNVADVGGGVNTLGAFYLAGDVAISDNQWIVYQGDDAVGVEPNDIALWRLANEGEDAASGLFVTDGLAGEDTTLYVVCETGYPLITNIPVLAVFEDYLLAKEDVALFDLQNPGYALVEEVDACVMELVDEQEQETWTFSFVDVSQEEGYYNALWYLYEQDIVLGTSETTFSPDEETTRGMLATLLYRLSGEAAVEVTLPFADVAQESDYAKGIAWVNAVGIMQGYSDTVFAPNDAVTAEQLAVILHRYALYQEVEWAQPQEPIVYTDQEDIASWALASVVYLQQGGIFQQDTLSPQSPIVRSDVVLVLMQFLQGM